MLYFLPRPSPWAYLVGRCGQRAAFASFRAREVGLSQNVVELLAFGSMKEFVLVKFA